MRDDSYPTQKLSASVDSRACRRCGANEFVTEPAKPPHHLAERCAACGLFQKFISKRENLQLKPYPEVTEQIRIDLPPADISHKSCDERFEKIERELAIVLRAIWACGVLQPKGVAPETDVDSRRVYHLADILTREDAGK